MSTVLKNVLHAKALNRWRLFWLIALPVSAMAIVEMFSVDLSTGEGVSEMIGFSVRFAVPILFIVVGTSGLQRLFPGVFSNWLLRNRKYVGMAFAVAMGWQGFFIFMMSNFHTSYYYEDIYLLRDEIEGSIGYIFLVVMVLTSFRFGRQHVNAAQWRLLHLSALYFLFAYAYSVYWWATSYYPNPQPYDFVYYWLGFAAFSLRIAAWGKNRQQVARKIDAEHSTPVALKLTGGALIAFGVVAAATGRLWQAPVTDFLTAPAWSANLVLWLPVWPFEPFLPLFIMGIGTFLLTRTKVEAGDSVGAAPQAG